VLHYPTQSSSTSAANSVGVSSIPTSGLYTVQSGDTLFSIAFRYGLDYRELAKFNRINPPYTIYPQQKIRLGSLAKPSSVIVDNVEPNAEVIVKQTAPIAQTGKAAPTVVPSSSAVIVSEKTPKSTAKDKKDEKVLSNWSLPVVGKVTRGFSNAGVSSKGIDIRAEQGALVKAAADGTVVYAGSGLIGYGNLVIVKHNDVYLSAYAYNERILVKEQQSVRVGDSLAVIGGKGTDRPLLHFEVRRDGRPIDPLDVLPKIN
jgi:lipoprotein NlpD